MLKNERRGIADWNDSTAVLHEMNMANPSQTTNDLFIKKITEEDLEDISLFGKGQVRYWLKRCKNCEGRKDTGHVEGKCLFQPTQFLAFTEEEARALASENTNPLSDMLRDQMTKDSFARQIMPVRKVYK